MTEQRHRTQLRICHERIAGDRHVHEARRPQPWQYCQLGAYAWCFTCSLYICEIHTIANHDRHQTQIEAPHG